MGGTLTGKSISVPTDEAITYYLTNQLAFEEIGRGFSVFRKFLRENGEMAIRVPDSAGTDRGSVRINRPRSAEQAIVIVSPRSLGQYEIFETNYLGQIERELSRPADASLSGDTILKTYVNPSVEIVSASSTDPLSYEPEFLQGTQRCIIVGLPESGKSTLLRMLCMQAIHNSTGPIIVPLVANLRDFDGRKPLLEYLSDQLSRVSVEMPPSGYLEHALSEGRVLLALDGLDEVLGSRLRSHLMDNIVRLCGLYPNSRVLVTSRLDHSSSNPS